MITVVVLSPAVDKIYFVKNFKAGSLYRIKDVVKCAGGKGINVSRVASILGEKVTAVGFKAGATGQWLDMQLKELGVNTQFNEVEGESRTNINIVDTMNKIETEVLEVGPTIKESELERFLKLYDSVLQKTEVVVCTGGLPDGVTADFYSKLIGIARLKGKKTILDASNEVLEEGIKAKPFIVKPNLRELSKYAGKELRSMCDIKAVCQRIVSQGVETVVASLDKEGALYVSREKIIRAIPPNITAVNTIGSGDSMIAGFAVSLLRGYPAEDMLRLGMACAAANTQYKEIGMVDPEMVQKYLAEISFESLDE